MGDFINNGSMTMDFQIQRAVDTSNVSDTPPQTLKKRFFPTKERGEIWKSQSLQDWELQKLRLMTV